LLVLKTDLTNMSATQRGVFENYYDESQMGKRPFTRLPYIREYSDPAKPGFLTMIFVNYMICKELSSKAMALFNVIMQSAHINGTSYDVLETCRNTYKEINNHAITVKQYGHNTPLCVTAYEDDIRIYTNDKTILDKFKENCVNPSIKIFSIMPQLLEYLFVNIAPIQNIPTSRVIHDCSICQKVPKKWIVQCPSHHTHQFDVDCMYEWYVTCHNSGREMTCPTCRVKMAGKLLIFRSDVS